jgi:hypothetical protein
MKFLAGTGGNPAEIESFAQTGYGTFPRAVISFALADNFIEFGGKQGADRQALFSG